MAKDPAFLFYPGDWLGGTMTLTRQEKGAYMDLLMAQFGHMTLTMKDIRTVLGPDINMWEECLKNKFLNEGTAAIPLYYNAKLRYEIERRRGFVSSRNNNKIGQNKDIGGHMTPHMTPHMTTHMTSHMENGNGNGNEVVNTVKNHIKTTIFRRPTIEQVKEYCLERNSCVDPEAFFHNYESTGWIKANGQKVQNWKSTLVTWEKKERQPISMLTETQKKNIASMQNLEKRIDEERNI